MKSSKGFSVIIPCYNSGKYIIEAVDSIYRQNFKYNFEVIVIDDCSDDRDTKNSFLKISNYTNLRIIRLKTNCGAQIARNTGIIKSVYDYIFCMDSDDKLNFSPDVLDYGTYPDTAIDILEQNKNIAFVYCTSMMFGGFNGLTISAYPISEELILRKHHAQTSIVYRKRDAIEAGLYDDDIEKWQDWSFAVSLMNGRLRNCMQNNLYFIDTPFYFYRIHDNPNRISSKDVSEEEMIRITFDKNPEIFKKYHGDLPRKLMSKKVLESKPGKIDDLLYIASYNLDRALDMVKERGLKVIGEKEPHNIP